MKKTTWWSTIISHMSASVLEPIKAVAMSLLIRDAPADRVLSLFDLTSTPPVTLHATESVYCTHVAHLIESRQPGVGTLIAARRPLGPIVRALEEEASVLLMHIYLVPPSFYVFVFQPMAQPPGCLFVHEQLALALVATGAPILAPVCIQVVRESASAGALPHPVPPIAVAECSVERICWTNAKAYAKAVPTAAVALGQVVLH
jgi:hypothetical protein